LLRLRNIMFDLKSPRAQATYMELHKLSSSTNLFEGPLFSDRERPHRVEQCLVDKRVEAFEEEDVLFVCNVLAGRHGERCRVD